MRTVALLSVVIAVTVVSASPARSQSPGPAAEKPPAAQTTRNVSGTIRSVSEDAVVVSGRDKGQPAEWTFGIEPRTRVRRAGKTVSTTDLKPGDPVQVRYLEREGKAQAESIVVHPTPRR